MSMSQTDILLQSLSEILDKYGVISSRDRENIEDISRRLVSSADNLLSHKASWENAFLRLIELEHEHDDSEFWEHELRAMKAMYDDIEDSSKP